MEIGIIELIIGTLAVLVIGIEYGISEGLSRSQKAMSIAKDAFTLGIGKEQPKE